MNKRFIVVLSAIGIFWSLPAASHHNSQMHYDKEQEMTVEGVVTQFRLVNPHARIYFDVTTSDGKTESWMAEGEAASVLKRQEWNDESLKKGESISIRGNPARDGSPLVEWLTITFPDGRVITGGNGQPAERAAFFEERFRREAAGRAE